MTETIKDLLEAYRRKALKPSEAISSFLDGAEALQPKLGALLQIRKEESIKRARDLDSRIGELDSLPLFGVPVAIKDNILVDGWQATAGSKILSDYVSPYTATCVARLQAAGAVVVGKANCDEFAMGSSNENSAFGPVANPWDLERVPGGSSGGSAAAVSSAMALGALGTDTGGSIRQPASLCGIVGIKPTYGRVSRYGVIAYASSLDQVGPFGRTVWDAARILGVISGLDPRDSTSSSQAVPSFTNGLQPSPPISEWTIGIPKDWLQGLEPDVEKAYQQAIDLLKKAGVRTKEISLPHAKYSLSTYYLIAPSEASSNLARYDGVHYGHRSEKATTGDETYFLSRSEGFGREVKLRIMLGTYALSAGYYDAYYVKANQVRRRIQCDFENAFRECQFVLVPTSPTTAFRRGAKSEDPLQMYLSDIFTLPVNLCGLPALSVPCALDSQSLPIGLQIIGRPFDETGLLQVAHLFERLRGALPKPNVFNEAISSVRGKS